MTTKPNDEPSTVASNRLNISLDWWAVITTLVLALLILLGVLPNIPW